MIRLVTDVDVARKALTRRHGFEETELSAGARERIRSIFGEDLSAEEVVDLIVAAVRSGGDRELRSLTERIDGGCPDELEVPGPNGQPHSTASTETFRMPSKSRQSRSRLFTRNRSGLPGLTFRTKAHWASWWCPWTG